MPTVAAGGGHILNIDFFVANLSRKRLDKGRCAKTNTLLTMKKKKKEENKEKKPFLNKLLKLWQILLLKLWQTQAELEAQSAIPSAGKESGKESADSAKLQSDCALDEVIK